MTHDQRTSHASEEAAEETNEHGDHPCLTQTDSHLKTNKHNNQANGARLKHAKQAQETLTDCRASTDCWASASQDRHTSAETSCSRKKIKHLTNPLLISAMCQVKNLLEQDTQNKARIVLMNCSAHIARQWTDLSHFFSTNADTFSQPAECQYPCVLYAYSAGSCFSICLGHTSNFHAKANMESEGLCWLHVERRCVNPRHRPVIAMT